MEKLLPVIFPARSRPVDGASQIEIQQCRTRPALLDQVRYSPSPPSTLEIELDKCLHHSTGGW